MRGLFRRAVPGLVLLLASAGLAAATSLDELRAKGLVGERFDGFAVVRPESPPEAKAVVERVNAERRVIYEKRAVETKADPAQVGRVYAKEILERAPRGTWFLQENGDWVRK